MKIFSALLAICAGNLPVTGEFPVQRSVTRSFDVFFDRCLNKRLSKQWRGWWFEMPSRPLWRHCNVSVYLNDTQCDKLSEKVHCIHYRTNYSVGIFAPLKRSQSHFENCNNNREKTHVHLRWLQYILWRYCDDFKLHEWVWSKFNRQKYTKWSNY